MKMLKTRSQFQRSTGMCFLFCVLLSVLLVLGACGESNRESRIHYVMGTALDGGDGTSWQAAFSHPQDALDAAEKGDQVWVAEGVYGPLQPDGKQVLALVSGVDVLGGFAGTETDLMQRDYSSNLTVLDGQGVSYHVVTGADDALLDGFTVTGGNADGEVVEGRYGGTFTGGGMFNAGVSPEVRNCLFTGNFATLGGGAVYNEDNHPLITDCTFEYNQADFGGAIQNRDSEPEIVNSIFRGNVSGISGGGVANFDGSPVFTNAVFSGNTSSGVGGAALGNSSNAVFTNCSFTGNRAGSSGGSIGMWEGSAQVKNCILWNNLSPDGKEVSEVNGTVSVAYSIVQGGYAGTGNIDEYPCFVAEGQWGSDGQWLEGNYQLSAASPAVDSGTSNGAPGFDAQYNLRPQALAHDRGAYERSGL